MNIPSVTILTLGTLSALYQVVKREQPDVGRILKDLGLVGILAMLGIVLDGLGYKALSWMILVPLFLALTCYVCLIIHLGMKKD